jgi:hypothetical protein
MLLLFPRPSSQGRHGPPLSAVLDCAAGYFRHLAMSLGSRVRADNHELAASLAKRLGAVSLRPVKPVTALTCADGTGAVPVNGLLMSCAAAGP